MKPIVRPASPRDAPYIEEISRLTWGGHDYLREVYRRWIEEGHFYVLEVDGRVVGTAKLTLMPCGAGLMEGLRVHPDYRGRGLSRLLHNHLIMVGRRLAEEGVIDSLMYVTSVRNEASKRLGLTTGFRIVTRFWYLEKEARERGEVERGEHRLPDIDLIPIGWRVIRRCGEALEWLRRETEAYAFRRSGFLRRRGSSSFTPYDYDLLPELVEGMEFVATSVDREEVGIPVPEDRVDLVEELRKRGFSVWMDLKEPVVLVFELRLK